MHNYKGDERKFRRERAKVMSKMIDAIKEIRPVVSRELPDEINIPEPYAVGTKIYGVHKSCDRDGEQCKILTTENVIKRVSGPWPEGYKFYPGQIYYPRYSIDDNRQALSHEEIFDKAVNGATYTTDPQVAEQLRKNYQAELDLSNASAAMRKEIWTPPKAPDQGAPQHG